MGWIDFVMIAVIGLSIWSGYRGGTIRTTISIVGMVAGIEFASRNFQRFAKELAPMVHSLEAANAIWFLMQVFVVILALSFVGNALHNEILGLETSNVLEKDIRKIVFWLDTERWDGVLGALLGLVRGIVLSAVCIMSVAAFFPGADTLPDALLPKYMAGTTAVLANLTSGGMHRKIIVGIESMDPTESAPPENTPDGIPPTPSNP